MRALNELIPEDRIEQKRRDNLFKRHMMRTKESLFHTVSGMDQTVACMGIEYYTKSDLADILVAKIGKAVLLAGVMGTV